MDVSPSCRKLPYGEIAPMAIVRACKWRAVRTELGQLRLHSSPLEPSPSTTIRCDRAIPFSGTRAKSAPPAPDSTRLTVCRVKRFVKHDRGAEKGMCGATRAGCASPRRLHVTWWTNRGEKRCREGWVKEVGRNKRAFRPRRAARKVSIDDVTRAIRRNSGRISGTRSERFPERAARTVTTTSCVDTPRPDPRRRAH